jgi:hypothetical protein
MDEQRDKRFGVARVMRLLFFSVLLLGVLSAGLFPATSGGNNPLPAYRGALSHRGREIYLEMAARSLAWPKTSEFTNSIDYLQAMFKDSELYSHLPFKGESNLWSVAANVPDDAPGFLPVLVSLNVDCTSLYRDLSESGLDEKIRFLDWKTPVGKILGKKTFVMIRKDGTVFTCSSKYMNARTVYQGQTFQTSRSEGGGGGEGLVYLTPDGIAVPRSR